jgi:hypothetical protein
MAKIKVADIVIDFSGARAFVNGLKSGSTGTNKGHRRAAERYANWLRRRYRQFSMGGGDWPDLAESTRRRKKQNKDVILVEYTNLYNSLSVRKRRQNEYTVGIFSQQQARRSNKTLQQIATIHQQGRGLPKREIVVMPSRGLYRGMVADIQKGVDADIRKANRGSK